MRAMRWWTRLVATTMLCVVVAHASPFDNPLLSFNAPPPSQQEILASVLTQDETLSSCKPTGQIFDARCDYETVETDINSANFFPILDNLRREKYFRLYKVDLYKDCPFWNDNSLCMSRDCTVSKMDDQAIPKEYRAAALSSVKMTNESDDGGGNLVQHSHAVDVLTAETDVDTCQCAETDFCHWEDEDWSPESSWVDLIDNPERFTGYSGTSARRVWAAIYEENCFGVARAVGASMSSAAGVAYDSQVKSARLGDPGSASAAAEALSSLLAGQSTPLDQSTSGSEQCLEKRVFYKIISGLHASISIHICHDYLDQQTGEWSPNLACFVERIAQHPDRLQNLYFTHTVLVRSLAKLGQRLGLRPTGGKKTARSTIRDKALQARELANLAPGMPSVTSATSVNLASLLLQALNAPPTFDEASMFDASDPESEYLRTEFRDRFRNVSRIMDCVGCDKCRLWGKLQVNGLGTALKILFEANQLTPTRLLQRSELVALINTVHRISESIRAVETFRKLYQKEVRSKKATEEGRTVASMKRKEDTTAGFSSARRIEDEGTRTNGRQEEDTRIDSDTQKRPANATTVTQDDKTVPNYHAASTALNRCRDWLASVLRRCKSQCVSWIMSLTAKQSSASRKSEL